MRKVFAGILLALSLPAMADLAADLKTMSPADALKKAKAECGASCDEAQEAKLVEEMIAAGIAPEVVAQAAKASGIKPAVVASGMTNAGLSKQAIAKASPEVAKAATVTQTKAPRAPKSPVVITPTTNQVISTTPPAPPANAGQPAAGSPT